MPLVITITQSKSSYWDCVIWVGSISHLIPVLRAFHMSFKPWCFCLREHTEVLQGWQCLERGGKLQALKPLPPFLAPQSPSMCLFCAVTLVAAGSYGCGCWWWWQWQYFEAGSHVADVGQLLSEAEAELIYLVIPLLPLEGWAYVPLCHHQG